MKKHILIFMIITLTFILASCNLGYKYVDGKVNIVATTTLLGELAQNIGGDKVVVTTLMKSGVDPHLYTPKPSDTVALQRADFVSYGGLNLEGKLVDVLKTVSKQKAYFNSGEVFDNLQDRLIKDEDGVIDPHIWFDVENWILVTNEFSKKLIDYDKLNEDYYTLRTNEYIEQLNLLKEWVITKVSELNIEKRILVTAHDAFQYYGRAYNFQVESIQGISTDSEASINDINNLVNLVVEKDVKAIFIENSVPKKTIQAVITSAANKKHDVVIGGELFADSLGNNEYNNYISVVKYNTSTIVDALK